MYEQHLLWSVNKFTVKCVTFIDQTTELIERRKKIIFTMFKYQCLFFFKKIHQKLLINKLC